MKSALAKLLFFFSAKIIAKYQPQIVGITGSVGKTSTKETVKAVLMSKFRVRGSAKSYNNEFGLPLTVIGFHTTPGRSVLGWLVVLGRAIGLLAFRDKNYPEILVLEMGADKPGDIRALVDIAPCNIGVLTHITHAHTEFFQSLKKIAEEKRKIISYLKKDGVALVNFDSPLVMEQVGYTKAQVVTYGFGEGADFRATDTRVIYDPATGWPAGINFKVHYQGHVVPVFLPGIIGEHLVGAALAALAIADVYKINLVEATGALEHFISCPGRMRLLPGVKSTLIIDDSYNASPEAMLGALHALGSVTLPRPSGRRYAVLGDMLELGPETENAHRDMGFRVVEMGVDYLITVGEAAKIIAHSAEEAGLDRNSIAMFADSSSAGRFLQDKLEAGDIVLVKGSRGIHMEKIVREIMADPERAEELLAG